MLEEGLASDWAVTWRGLSVSVRARRGAFFGAGREAWRRVLRDLTGGIRAGSLVVLMGPSGAGKSTLMEALAGRSAGGVAVRGDVRVRGLSGFVHQEEVFVGALTVREHLVLMGRLKLGRGGGGGEVERAVERVVVEMGLVGCAERRIGGGGGGAAVLSGGERKRLAFATEVLTEPEVLFCDEPTTGLDACSAQHLVMLMKRMSSRGKTILCTVHQPSSEVFWMFEEVILLAEGRTAYMGDAEGAVKALERHGFACPRNYNPAEMIIEALSGPSKGGGGAAVKRVCDEYSASEAAKRMEEMLARQAEEPPAAADWRTAVGDRRSSWMEKLLWLSYRSFLQVLRDPSVQAVRILQKLGIALMAGLCFFGSIGPSQAGVQSVQGAIFLLVTENTFPPMYGVLPLFPDEFPLFLREHRSHLYSPHLYYIAKTISLLPGLILEPLLFVALAYLISGLRRTLQAFLATAAIAVLTTNVATACGSLFSNAFGSPALALAALVPVDYALMATSGLFARLTSLPPPVACLRHLSWFMYANEALTALQWDGVSNITCDHDARAPCLRNGSDVLRSLDFSPNRLPLDVIAMALLCCVFHLLAYASLRWKTNRTSSRRS